MQTYQPSAKAAADSSEATKKARHFFIFSPIFEIFVIKKNGHMAQTKNFTIRVEVAIPILSNIKD